MTRDGSEMASSSTIQIPSANSARRLSATCSASRVLPQPPGPTRVTSRFVFSSAFSSAVSRSRPIKLVSCRGRLLATFSGGGSGRGGEHQEDRFALLDRLGDHLAPADSTLDRLLVHPDGYPRGLQTPDPAHHSLAVFPRVTHKDVGCHGFSLQGGRFTGRNGVPS